MSTARSWCTELAPRWHGEPGRTEVWYCTATDVATGLGIWIHHETVAPTDGRHPYAHGWTTVFAASGPPRVERFGPTATVEAHAPARHVVDGCTFADGWLRGEAGALRWELDVDSAGAPLYTFSRAVWRRQLLPAAQIVPAPDARVHGRLVVDGVERAFDGPGAVARIYGHGNAQRWAWLHAHLGYDTTLEIVTAIARRPGLRALPPLALVQLRSPGERDWPAQPLLAALRFRTRIGDDEFVVRGRSGGRRLDVRVSLPPARTVSLEYVDPDGATATCRNSEVASADIEWGPTGATRTWRLDGVAHAEIGTRP